jgi:PAS domain S-box-containing protein
MSIAPRNNSMIQSAPAVVSKWAASVLFATGTVGSVAGMFVLRAGYVVAALLGMLALVAGWATVRVVSQFVESATASAPSSKSSPTQGSALLPVQQQHHIDGGTTFSCTREKMDLLLENEQLRAILKWVPVGIVYFGLDRTVRFCNPAFCKLYGFEESELLGQTAPLPEDRREEWKVLEEQLRRGEQFCHFETVRMRKDGTLFRAYISGVPCFTCSGELAGLLGVIVEAENMPIGAIEYEHIMALAESSSDFLLLLDSDLRVIYANPGFSVATGLDDAALQGTNVLDYFPPKEHEAIESHFREAVVSERTIYVLKAHIHSRDTEMDIPVRLEFYPVYGSDVKSLSGIACIAHDLQKEMELREQLRQSEAESQMLFDCCPIGIVKVNTQGVLLISNKKFQEMMGYMSDEIIGRPFSTFVFPDDLREGRALFLELAAGRIDHYEILKRLVRKDGAVIQATMSVSLVRDASGRPSHTISMVTLLPDGMTRVESHSSPYVSA